MRVFAECDRCGAHFSLPADTKKANAIKTLVVDCTPNRRAANDEKKYTLCDKCMAEVEDFIEHNGDEA